MGVAQTRKIETIIGEKRRLAATYNHLMADIGWLQLPPEQEWARNVYWMYAVVLREGAPVPRQKVIERLRADGIDTRTFFCPMSQQPCVTAVRGYRPVRTPVADRLWRDGFYLPSSTQLTSADLERVSSAVRRAGQG